MGGIRLGILHFKDHFKQKCHFLFLINWVLLKPPLWKIATKSYFSDFESIFCYLLKIFLYNKPASSKAKLVWNYNPASHSHGKSLEILAELKSNSFGKRFFETNLDLRKHPQQLFTFLPNFFLILFNKKIIQLFLRSSDSFVQYFTNSRWKSAEK